MVYTIDSGRIVVRNITDEMIVLLKQYKTDILRNNGKNPSYATQVIEYCD